MKALRVLLLVVVAVTLQATIGRFLVRGAVGVDLVLVAVVYLALTLGPTAGIASGTLAGLAQDPGNSRTDRLSLVTELAKTLPSRRHRAASGVERCLRGCDTSPLLAGWQSRILL